MTPIFTSLPATLGVYTLTRRLGSTETLERYIANQSHVDRSVILEVLRPDMPQPVVDAFVSNARARVVESIPHVSRVLESMCTKGTWYTTLECPEGTPLSRLREQGKRLTTVQACAVLEQVAGVYTYCASKGIAAGALTDDSIFIKKNDDVTVLSPVISGTHNDRLLPVQQDSLAAAIRPVRPTGVAGETRINTLLDWLEQGVEGQRLDWEAISATVAQVREQVGPRINKQQVAYATDNMGTRAHRVKKEAAATARLAITAGVALAAVIIITCLGFVIGPFLPAGYTEAVHGGYAYCATPAGGQMAVRSRLVSIGEYNTFLETYNTASQGQREEINQGLPGSAIDHTPADWDAQWKAAANGKKWRGKKLSLKSPVTGVSYWDALAYANYMGATLPEYTVLQNARQVLGGRTLEEWTGSVREPGTVYNKAYLILPEEAAETPVLEGDPARRQEGRAFRLAYPGKPKAKH